MTYESANASVATPASGLPVALCEWDGCAPLSPKQKRFASARCRAAWHDVHRPRLASGVVGHSRAGTIKALVLGVLTDGEWHSAYDLSIKVRAGEHSIKTRISELRAAGHGIEEDLAVGNSRRPHRYRLFAGSVRS